MKCSAGGGNKCDDPNRAQRVRAIRGVGAFASAAGRQDQRDQQCPHQSSQTATTIDRQVRESLGLMKNCGSYCWKLQVVVRCEAPLLAENNVNWRG